MKALVALLSVLLLTACTKINYVGEEHFPSSRLDIYYDEADVNREYRVMGEAVASGNWTTSFEKMQDKLKKKAMAKGAHGVIILNWGWDERTTLTEKTVYTDSSSETSLSTETSETGVKEIRALLIRYE